MECLWTFKQTIALPLENLYFEVERKGAWSENKDNGWTSAYNICFICPKCYRMWGMLTGLPDNDIQMVTSNCLEHAENTYERIDGSILFSYAYFGYGGIDLPLLEALPIALLKREFELHLNYAEKEFAV